MSEKKPHLLTARELSDAISVPYVTVLRLAKAGRIPCYRLNERVVRFNLDEVLDAVRDAHGERGAAS